MPLTVMSFVGLAEGTLGPVAGKPFFDGLQFHRVVPGFVIQGGDPTGTGRGGPGYRFPDEFAAGLRHDGPGWLSMANSGPDTNGSQFFITLGPARYLDFVHAIFGRVTEGLDLLPQIQPGDTMQVKIIRRGAVATGFRADRAAFDALLARASHWNPPHLEDKMSATAGAPPWQAKYLEMRLSNLARFTGREIYVRLVDRLEPEAPGETTAEALEQLWRRLHLASDAILVCYTASDDSWQLKTGRQGVALPAAKTGADGPPQSGAPRIYHTAEEIVSSLIDQTDPQ
jgi:cyclophilin family peptidyl-prolyl cis-trans isomerase